jgi:hypothetical protein
VATGFESTYSHYRFVRENVAYFPSDLSQADEKSPGTQEIMLEIGHRHDQRGLVDFHGSLFELVPGEET